MPFTSHITPAAQLRRSPPKRLKHMEENNKNKIWFPAMKYGVGWGFPVTWQGWAILLVYMLLMIVGGLFLTGSPFGIVFFPIYAIFLSLLVGFICWKRGEKPEFRWGNKK